MTLPKISVVVPSFNQAHFIEATLRSILDQNYGNLELVVIDGGSTDGSQAIIERYADSIEYWVSEPDGGQTYGLVKGFSHTTGDIQCWINSDDMMAPGCLAEVADFFQSRPEAEAVYGDTTWIDRNGEVLRQQKEIGFNRFIWTYTHNYIPGMSMYWRRRLYERVGGLDPAFNLAMDADLWARFADVTRIYHKRAQWSFMRFYPEQKNRAMRARSDIEEEIIHQRYWPKEGPRFLELKRLLARSLRIAARLVTGCYSFSYRRNMADSSGG